MVALLLPCEVGRESLREKIQKNEYGSSEFIWSRKKIKKAKGRRKEVEVGDMRGGYAGYPGCDCNRLGMMKVGGC